jgi:predicted DNA-binding transcriptional regulator YafY
MWETVHLNGMEQQRLVVLNRVLVGDLTAAEAADAVGRSVRQVRRMLAAYRKEGAAALAHGNRGRYIHGIVSFAVHRIDDTA